MPNIIVKCGYLKSGSHKSFGGYIKYIATRSGVEVPVPQLNNQAQDVGTFVQYMGTRPGVEKMGSHGLFTEGDQKLIMDKVAKEVEEHQGTVWTIIVSLPRVDAERMQYTNATVWKQLIERNMGDVAKAMKINIENLKWYAAYHDKENNPHVHIVVYSKKPSEGYLTKKGIDNIRSAFANDIYRDELNNLYQQQTIVRDRLREESKKFIEELSLQVNNPNVVTPELISLVKKLSSQLSKAKGKKVYGYLQPDVKKTVDDIVNVLAEHKNIKLMYEEWCKLEQEKHYTYSGKKIAFPKLSENKVFKPIKNSIINAVQDMNFQNENLSIVIDELNTNDETVDVCPEPEEQFKENVLGETVYVEWNPDYREARNMIRAEHDYETAFKILRLEAECGNALAMYDLAAMYERGLINDEYGMIKAKNYYRKALGGFLEVEPKSDKMRPWIQYKIGRMYQLGLGTFHDSKKAFEWFSLSAEKDNHYAMFSVGKMLLFDKEIPRDVDKALKWLKLAADNGNSYAASMLGYIEKYNQSNVQQAAVNMFTALARLISDDYNFKYRAKSHTDRKLRAAILRKKLALGIKPEQVQEPESWR